jgi:hypothetical protein
VGALCRDRIDNDCDLKTDCQSAVCDGVSCSADAGPDCRCSADAGAPVEMNCADRLDNDGDLKVDCADSTDCPQGTPCKYKQVSSGNIRDGNCTAVKTCQ